MSDSATTDLEKSFQKALSVVQAQDREWVLGRMRSHRRTQNPFVANPSMDGGYTVGFWTENRNTSEPLWWTGSGFKNLQRAPVDPEEYPTKDAAELAVRTQILNEIKRWRKDQVHLIFGWENRNHP